MTNEINMPLAASQRPASGAGKAREAVASEQTAKPDSRTATQVSAKTESKQVLSSEQIEQAVQRLNDLAQSLQRQLKFNVDDDTGRMVITVKDKKTDEIVRQIPSEEVLSLISRFQKFDRGLFEEMV